MCKLIISNSNDKNPANSKGFTPLHFAARKGHLDICKLIMKHSGHKNPSAKNGITPLSLASTGNHLEVCMLIQKELKENRVVKPLQRFTPWM